MLRMHLHADVESRVQGVCNDQHPPGAADASRKPMLSRRWIVALKRALAIALSCVLVFDSSPLASGPNPQPQTAAVVAPLVVPALQIFPDDLLSWPGGQPRPAEPLPMPPSPFGPRSTN